MRAARRRLRRTDKRTSWRRPAARARSAFA